MREKTNSPFYAILTPLKPQHMFKALPKAFSDEVREGFLAFPPSLPGLPFFLLTSHLPYAIIFSEKPSREHTTS